MTARQQGPRDGSSGGSGGDRGSIVLGWLTKLVLVLSVLGVLAFDGISVVVARYSAEDRATQAARAASAACESSRGNVQHAYDAAFAIAEEFGDSVDTATFRCVGGGAVSLQYTREAATLVLSRVGPLRDLAVVTARAEASPPR